MTQTPDPIKKILDELVHSEAFRGRDQELENLIRKLSHLTNNPKPHPEFVKNLREKLLQRADMLKKTNSKPLSLFNLIHMKKINIAITAIAAILLFVVLGGFYSKKDGIKLSNFKTFPSKLEITKLENRAFGQLALAPTTGARSQSGGGGGLGAAPPSSQSIDVKSAPVGGERGGIGSSIGIVPPFPSFKYVYRGDDFSVDEAQVSVYRRAKGFGGDYAASSILKNLNFGVIDLGRFDNQYVQSVNLAEDKDFGYAFFINFEEGLISITENWKKWQTPDRLCADENCFEQYRLKIGDIPDDQTLINLANQFLGDHNISLENYGSPYVQDFWRQEYEIMQDKSQVYIPDMVTVIYPLKINGSEVYDEGGNKTGLTVAINVRVGKVSGVYDLPALRFDSSFYEAETDVKKLISIAENGGFRGGYYYAESENQSEIELGTPITSYVKIWQYVPQKAESQELIVPSLIFPIVKGAEVPYFYQQNVIVPLVKDVLENVYPGGPIPLPAITEPAQ